MVFADRAMTRRLASYFTSIPWCLKITLKQNDNGGLSAECSERFIIVTFVSEKRPELHRTRRGSSSQHERPWGYADLLTLNTCCGCDVGTGGMCVLSICVLIGFCYQPIVVNRTHQNKIQTLIYLTHTHTHTFFFSTQSLKSFSWL